MQRKKIGLVKNDKFRCRGKSIASAGSGAPAYLDWILVARLGEVFEGTPISKNGFGFFGRPLKKALYSNFFPFKRIKLIRIFSR